MGFWYKDISDILKLNRNLEDVGDVLVEENAMLEGAIRLSEKKIKVEEKNQLYNEIAREVSPQLKELNELLDSLEQNDQDIREKLCYGGVLNVYIKRCSNLLIMSRQSGVLNVGELWLALSESLEYSGYMESRLMERKKEKDSFTEKMQFWYMSLLKRL